METYHCIKTVCLQIETSFAFDFRKQSASNLKPGPNVYSQPGPGSNVPAQPGPGSNVAAQPGPGSSFTPQPGPGLQDPIWSEVLEQGERNNTKRAASDLYNMIKVRFINIPTQSKPLLDSNISL